MRVLSLIFIIVFTISVSAQTPFIQKTFDEATRAAQVGNYETAIENYRKAILLSESEKIGDNFLARIHFNIGVCLYHLKRNAEAVEEFTEAIKLSKRNHQKAFYALGMSQVELKNWRKAETAFREAVNLEKSDGEAWFDLAMVLLEEKDFEAARKAFQNAVKYKSVSSADAHNNLGVIYALADDFESAENEFKTALLESNGKSIEAGNNLRFCKLYKQNFNRNLLAKFEFSRRNETGD
jgi:Flp pilus assembly protein TadD